MRRAAEVPAGNYDLTKVMISTNPMLNISKHLWVLYFSLLSWGALLYFQKGYDVGVSRAMRAASSLCALTPAFWARFRFWRLWRCCSWETSRLFIVGLLIVGVLIMWGTRVFVGAAGAARRRGRSRNVLLIGSQASAQRYNAMLETPAYQWSRLIGYVDDARPTRSDARGCQASGAHRRFAQSSG